MKYKITISNHGNHFCNPLLALDGREFSTRDDACEAIYSRLCDVIDGENGCEMVDKADTPKAYWILSGEGISGNWERIVCTKDRVKHYINKARCGGDRWAKAITDIYTTKDLTLAGVLVDDDGTLGSPVDAPSEAVDDIGEANDIHELYIKSCRDYIFEHGYATHDGVSAIVEEMSK